MRNLLLLIPLLAACEETTTQLTERCDVYLSALSPDSALPGASVAASARPVTEPWDTAVFVGGVRAEVGAVSRTDCSECDACKALENCTECDACSACEDVCRERCLETVQFTVPAVDPGTHSVSLINKHGHSTSLPFTVLERIDTGGSDTSSPDSGDSLSDSGQDASR
jgi:hypothetical protein